MTQTLNNKFYTYSPHEVIAFKDDEHIPYNKRAGEVDSILNVEVRAPITADWVSFHCQETTTTKNYGDKADRTASRVVRFSMSKQMFDAIVAHVRRTEDHPE